MTHTAFLSMALLLAACGGSTEPHTQPGGLYLLAQVNGKALPTLDARGDSLFSGAIELRPNGTYRLDTEGRSFTFIEEGAWVASGTTIQLTSGTATYSPRRVSMTRDRGDLVFTQP